MDFTKPETWTLALLHTEVGEIQTRKFITHPEQWSNVIDPTLLQTLTWGKAKQCVYTLPEDQPLVMWEQGTKNVVQLLNGTHQSTFGFVLDRKHFPPVESKELSKGPMFRLQKESQQLMMVKKDLGVILQFQQLLDRGKPLAKYQGRTWTLSLIVLFVPDK